MVLVAVEFVPAESTPPAAAGVSISKGERYDFGAAALLPTRVSSLEQGRARGPVKSSPKLVELFGSGSTRFCKNSYPHASFELLSRRPPCASESSCMLARLPSWQDVAAERPAVGMLNADRCLSNPP